MNRTLQYALATGALALGLGRVASAAMAGTGTSMMHGGGGMSGGGMMGGGMMSMMMGDDPVATCSSMMRKVAANPKLHREMNAMMKSQMKSSDVTPSKPLPTPTSTP